MVVNGGNAATWRPERLESEKVKAALAADHSEDPIGVSRIPGELPDAVKS